MMKAKRLAQKSSQNIPKVVRVDDEIEVVVSEFPTEEMNPVNIDLVNENNRKKEIYPLVIAGAHLKEKEPSNVQLIMQNSCGLESNDLASSLKTEEVGSINETKDFKVSSDMPVEVSFRSDPNIGPVSIQARKRKAVQFRKSNIVKDKLMTCKTDNQSSITPDTKPMKHNSPLKVKSDKIYSYQQNCFDILDSVDTASSFNRYHFICDPASENNLDSKIVINSDCNSKEGTSKTWVKWHVSKDTSESVPQKIPLGCNPSYTDNLHEDNSKLEYYIKKEHLQSANGNLFVNSEDIKPHLDDKSDLVPFEKNEKSVISGVISESPSIISENASTMPHWLSPKEIQTAAQNNPNLETKLAIKNMPFKDAFHPQAESNGKEKLASTRIFSTKNYLCHNKQPRKNELALLYDNLKEISWAQDESFTSLLDETEKRYCERFSVSKTPSIRINCGTSKVTQHSKHVPRSAAYQRQCKLKSLHQMKEKQCVQSANYLQRKLRTRPKISLHKQWSPMIKHMKKTGAESVLKKYVKNGNCSTNSSKIKSHIPEFRVQNLGSKRRQCSLRQSQSVQSIFHCNRATKINKNITHSFSLCKKLLKNDNRVVNHPKRKHKTAQLNSQKITNDIFYELNKFSINSFVDDDDDERIDTVVAALQKGPELRVTLEPLENMDLWTTDSYLQNTLKKEYETFRKKSIQQTMFKVFSGLDQRHVESVLREVQDSIIDAVSSIKPSKRRRYDEESIRSSVRQSECAFRYKEIVVKKHQNYIQMVLVPNINKQNCLTVEAMKELREALLSARKDSNCRAVLINSSGSFFCSGIDLGHLLGSNKKQAAEEMAITIRDLILTLGTFPKPVVAAVNGTTVGLGVSLLTFCDIVLASDKATFCIPSARLGYLPEGGVTLTLPQVVGATVALEILLQGRRLTAQQALSHGLVSEVLWPTQLMEEVIPRMQMLVSQPLQVMEATKTMVRCHLWEKLAVQLEREWRMLPSQWLSATCQQKIKCLQHTGWLFD